MSSFNRKERVIARFLARFPFMKKTIKCLYTGVNYVLNKRNYLYKTHVPMQTIDNTVDNETFFGYYDKSPVNQNYHYIIYHSSTYQTINKPNPAIPLEIVAQNIVTKEVLLRIPSSVYNWQQGCRTQWLTDDLFIFNDFDITHKRYIARVWSVSALKEERTFDYPVQDSYKTDYLLSLNYQRLMTLRPDYGYHNLPLLNKTELADKDSDGIWKIDYNTGNSRLLVSLSSLCLIKPDVKMDSGFHKINHIMISPSGKQFIFVHRYYINKRRFDRLFLGDIKSEKITLLADYEMISHYFWADEETILGYLRGPDKRDGYWLINTNTGVFTYLLDGKLDSYGDGHPHVHGDWFVTDTYPDKARMQHLILCNWKTGEIKELGEFFHGFKYSGETRCDLHPRFSPDGKSVYFDSVFSSKRQFYRMEII